MRFLKQAVWCAAASAAFAQQPIGQMQSGDATIRGAVQLTGASATIMSGAQIDAAQRSATIRLQRGGELVICPQSGVTLTSSASGRDQLIGVSRGSVEAHYPLAQNSDTVMTPDFRLQLKGPARFDVGVGLFANGDACIESQPSSTGTVGVSELFGEGVFEVQPGERWLFSNSTVSGAQRDPQVTCGCPAPPQQQKVALSEMGFPEEQSRQAAEAIAAGKPVPETLPAASIPSISAPGAVHMQIDAPMIFRAEEAGPPLPPLVARAALRPASFPAIPTPQVAPPPKAEKKGWFRRFGSAIARMFGARNS
jgi:hypothetical protein